MEQPKRRNFTENIRPIENDDEVRPVRVDEGEIDVLAKKGHFKLGDEPGTDTYDDGLNEKGEVVMPGSTSTESGANYMEDRGPNDLRRRNEEDIARAREGGLTISKAQRQSTAFESATGRHDEEPHDDILAGNDPAAKWLRENDPNYKGNDELREAA